jgi:hypothetical protein
VTPKKLLELVMTSDAPALIHGPEIGRLFAVFGKGRVDLRQHDLPVSMLARRLAMASRWERDRSLVVSIDERPSEEVVSLLFEASVRAFNLSATEVRRFDRAKKLVVLTRARAVPSALVRLFPLRVEASRLAGAAPAPAPRGTPPRPKREVRHGR